MILVVDGSSEYDSYYQENILNILNSKLYKERLYLYFFFIKSFKICTYIYYYMT